VYIRGTVSRLPTARAGGLGAGELDMLPSVKKKRGAVQDDTLPI
jgi:hypothetical protein